MLKSAILLFNAIALLMYEFFFAGDITVTQKIPASAKPETEFTVELTINKGSTTGFAKLQQELPDGFTAVEDKNAGGSFTFNNQTVKFIWMSLPNDSEFKVSYKVKVAEGFSGDQSIAGKFSYVVDNEKKSYDIAPSTINIEGGDGSTANNTATDNTTTTSDNTTTGDNTNTASNTTTDNTAGNTTEPGDGSFNCVRTVPSNPPAEFVVELNVSKGNLGGFAKLVENLPEGYTASSVENAGGSFSFADQKVRFIWVSLPAEPEFKISYKVTAPANSGTQSITGTFSYIEDDNTRKFDVLPSSVTVGSEEAVAVNTNTNPEPDPGNSATTIPAAQNGVYYKVQIIALQNSRNTSTIANYYGLSNIEKTNHEGLNKYLIKTTHNDYKSARDARENVRGGVVNKNLQVSQPAAPPFVVAFNNGKRVPVQDALMTSGQTWYR